MLQNELYKTLSAPLVLRNDLTLPSRAIMSPMEGLMNNPLFFLTMQALDLAEFWMPPFQGISENAVPSPGALRKKFNIYMQNDIPFFLQVLGHSPDAASKCAYNAACADIKGLNFNFACPSKTVLKSSSGGWMLKEPRLMGKMLLAARNAVPEMCISVKMRTGFSDAKESRTLLQVMKDSGVDLVICHARLVEEKYASISNEVIRERMIRVCEEAGDIPVFGNGDICSTEKAKLYMDCACTGVAAARGLLVDPWLLKRLKGEEAPSPEEGKKLFLETFRKSLSGRQGAGTYAECVKIAFGEDSEEFRKSIEFFRSFQATKMR